MNMDDNRFKAIYEEYYQHLFHFCLSYVHQKEEAEDIVQDVFFNLYVKPCKDVNIKAWLFTCVANRAKNYLKRKKNSIKIYQEYYLRSKNAESNEERNYDLFKIIDRMPAKYKEVINYYYFAKLSVNEISAILKISDSNVKKRLERGRNYMKNELKGEDYYE